MLPACYRSKSTVHEYFQYWNKAVVIVEILRILLSVVLLLERIWKLQLL